MTAVATVGQRIPIGVPLAVATAWLLALAAEATGTAAVLHHDTLLGGGTPPWAAAPVFLLAWQIMIAAMMVPSSLPLIRLFAAATRHLERPGLLMATFLGGYALVWSAFGAVALLGDLGVHELAQSSPWLHDHERLIAGGVLLAAGAFQFSAVKKRCLAQCRLPASFLRVHYARGYTGAFRLGRRHGLYCVGCCAALMLITFAAGVANLLWMATLTALMVYEKTGRAGTRAVPIAGAALLVWAAAVVASPGWLPPMLLGAL